MGPLPNWPRLMSAKLAAAYVSMSETTIRERGPKPKRFGKRCLWDIHDLDRWAESLNDDGPGDSAMTPEERLFFARRKANG